MQSKNSPRNLQTLDFDLCFRNPGTHVHILLWVFQPLEWGGTGAGVGRDWGGSGGVGREWGGSHQRHPQPSQPSTRLLTKTVINNVVFVRHMHVGTHHLTLTLNLLRVYEDKPAGQRSKHSLQIWKKHSASQSADLVFILYFISGALIWDSTVVSTLSTLSFTPPWTMQ